MEIISRIPSLEIEAQRISIMKNNNVKAINAKRHLKNFLIEASLLIRIPPVSYAFAMIVQRVQNFSLFPLL